MTTAVSVKELAAEHASVTKRMTELAPEGKLPAGDRVEFDALRTKEAELRESILEARTEEERIADLKRATAFQEEPQRRIDHTPDGGDETTRTLIKAGWERKNGMLHAPTSYKGGQMVPVFPEEVLFDDADVEMTREAKQYAEKVRATFDPEYKRTFTKWLRFAVGASDAGIGMAMLNPAEQGIMRKALSESQDTAGGFLVPPDIMAEMLVRTADKAIMRQLCRTVPTSRDLLVWPRAQASATNGSIYSSGFIGGWVGETPAFTNTDPAFGQFQIAIKKARTTTQIANDFISDSAVPILSFLSTNGSENLALVEDQAFIAGVGDGLHPKGVQNSGASKVDVGGSTSHTISNTSSAVGSAPLLYDLIYALPPQYRAGAQFLMSPQVEKAVRKLVDANNRFLFLGVNDGSYSGRPGAMNLDGFNVNSSQFMPDNSAVTDDPKIIFGQFTDYIIATRTQMSVTVLRERFADTDQTGIIIFDRVGGDTWNEDAFRIGYTHS